MKTYYGYVDYTDSGEPFYVGKGTAARVRNTERNRKHANVARKYGQNRQVEFVSTDEHEVLRWEVATILKLQTFGTRHGCNLTAGGVGNSGWVPASETRAKIAKASRKWNAAKTAEQRSETTRKGHANRSQEVKVAVSEKARAQMLALDAEKRSERAKIANAGLSREQRLINVRKAQAAWASLSEEQRKERRHSIYTRIWTPESRIQASLKTRKNQMAKTCEQRHAEACIGGAANAARPRESLQESAHKTWVTRRKKYGKSGRASK